MDDALSRLDNDRDRYRLLQWLVTAPELRDPSTEIELAAEIGVDARSLRRWKREDMFLRVWRAEAYDVVGSPEETQRVIEAMRKTALDPFHKQHVAAANTFLKAVGGMTPPAEAAVAQATVLESMSLAELEELAVGIFGKRLDELGVKVSP